MKIKFFKYQGAGNDFIIIDKIADPDLSFDAKTLSQNICERHYGVGADGLVILEKQNDQLQWTFFNSDGSYAAMCGNAARCVAKHLYKQHHISTAELQTGAGLVSIKKIDEKFQVEMPAYKNYEEVDESVIFVNTGVPHFVVSVHKDEDVFSYIKEYRWHPLAGENGSNISFYYADGKTFKAKTFERGVEGFTLACGTGAAACGLAIYKKTKQNPVTISMPGGDLQVRIDGEKIYLLGQAELICSGDYHV